MYKINMHCALEIIHISPPFSSKVEKSHECATDIGNGYVWAANYGTLVKFDGTSWTEVSTRGAELHSTGIQIWKGFPLVIGGGLPEGGVVDTVEYFTYGDKNRWRTKSSLPKGVKSLSSINIESAVITVGGLTYVDGTSQRVGEIFSFKGDAWTIAGNLLTARNQLSIFKLSSSTFYVIGGWGDNGTSQPGKLAVEKVSIALDTASSEEESKGRAWRNGRVERKCLAELRVHSNITAEYGGSIKPSEDEDLIKFLRARKFDVQKAADLFRSYHTKRLALHDFSKLQSPSSYKDYLKTLAQNFGEYIAVLDRSDTQGRRIIICRESASFESSESADANRPSTLWFFLILDWLLATCKDMQVNGIVVITDMKDFSLSQFQWLLTHPGALKERITSIQDGVPMRIKSIRIANEPMIFSMVYALVSPFLKQKLRQRIKTVSTRYEEIYKILDGSNNENNDWKKIMPKSVGGKMSWSELTDSTVKNVLDYYLQFDSIE
ncbi:Oidioi.mRNA.OKI2018_I69.PAR.g11502.t1.cds [Oikopleura dioica]|uniref:Oidioi.mRNA.OKI2018_I69.PAR.g11502.t1.cds n=1 Tax=Oikopleura dioica TaxID=34765 RepID=A0ABN7RW03_OIKDI|nr:Oidioi.mRNA.OKI2018_I69.PAR.g11502.t1.cds [Oikopleura dioica]